MTKTAGVEVNLPVTFIQEGGKIVAYTPALDISTTGSSEAEAKERFAELVNLFMEDLIENETVDSVLTSLGWMKESKGWNPPVISQESLRVQVPALV